MSGGGGNGRPELSQHGSPFNFDVLGGAATRAGRPVAVLDLTLEGDCEEMAGMALASEARLEIARRLDELGVARLAVLGNSPRPAPDEIADAGRIAGLGLRAKVCSFAKTAEEIDTAADIGLWGTVILIGVNERFFAPGTTPRDVVDLGRRLTAHAKRRGLHTTIMAMDTTRANPLFVKSFLDGCADTTDEVVICDSIGVASPWGFERLVGLVRDWTRKPIQVHCHNHTGVAVANALAAVRAGADIVHTAVNGWGEFAGQTALEELAVALQMHLGLSAGLRLDQLTGLSAYVAAAAGLPLPVNKPVTGAAAFAIPETEEIQEAFSIAAAAGELDAALTFPPAAVGNRVLMSMGRKCNRYTVAFALAELGLAASADELERIAEGVRRCAGRQRGHYLMAVDEFGSLLEEGGFAVSPLP